MDRDGGALSVQVLEEFYAEATRPIRPDRLPHQTAQGLVVAWTRFRVQPNTLSIMVGATEIAAAQGLAYRDAALAAVPGRSAARNCSAKTCRTAARSTASGS